MKKILVVIFTFSFLQIYTSAQNFWEQTNGPFGAFALTLACDSAEGLYTGTMTQGLYKSSDVGDHWYRIGLNGQTIKSILAYTDQLIFVASDDGFYQTSDGGVNWSKNNFTATANTLYKTLNGSIILGTQQQIYRSSDMGLTWQNTTGNIPNVAISSLSLDLTGFLYAAAGNKGILVSNDDGMSWIQSNIGLPPTDHHVRVVFVKDNVNTFAYVASPTSYTSSLAGIYISTDFGASWTQKSNLLPVSQFAVTQDGNLLAGVYDDLGFHPYNNGIYHSSNLGSNWYLYPNQTAFNVRALLITSEGYIISGNYYSGLFISKDNGNTWEGANTGINNSDITDVYSATSGSIFCSRFSLDYSHGGVYRSRDEGNSWEKLNTGSNDPNVRAFFSDNQGNVYAGDFDLFRSSDDGDNWQVVKSGMGLFYCFAQKSNGTLFAGSSDYGIFRSTNNGLTWYQSNLGLTNLTIFTLTVTNLGTILAGSFGGIIFRSTNDGINWEAINTFHNSTVLSLYNTTNNIILAGLNADFNHCMLKSTDEGITWDPVTPFPRVSIRDITENAIGDIFAACHYDGIYRSRDNGNSWSLLSNEGISNFRIQTMSVSSGGYIYVGTWRGSLFRTIQSTTDVDEVNLFPREISIEQNYPNPFNPSTTIRYEIPEQSLVTIKIYDVLGNEIATLVNEEKPAGSYKVEFNSHSGEGRNLPSGVYFYQLKILGTEINSGQGIIQTKKMVLMK